MHNIELGLTPTGIGSSNHCPLKGLGGLRKWVDGNAQHAEAQVHFI